MSSDAVVALDFKKMKSDVQQMEIGIQALANDQVKKVTKINDDIRSLIDLVPLCKMFQQKK